jgi:tape measure domain-containing protein
MAGENNDFKIIIGADIADAKSKLKDLSNSLSSLSRNTGVASGSIGASMGKISSLFSGLGTTLSVASFGLFIKSALQTSAQLEQTAISFEVFTGSALVAKNMLSDLKEQALKSPMQFQDITKGAQTLLGYGLTAQQVIPITKMLGDISGGNADKFQRLSLAFGQVNAAGRLMGQEARQMINAGFNPLQAISDKTGVSMAVLTKRMHDGQISVKDVGDAFTYATSEGGRFFGMADRQSQTLQGQFNKLSESTTFAMAEIGASISENLQLGDIITHLAGIIDQLKNSFIGVNQEMNNSSEFSKVLKFTLDALGITIDLTIKAWKAFTFVLDGLLKLGTPIVSFFDEVDLSIIKFAGIIGNQKFASDIKSFIGYFNDFGKTDVSPKNITDSISVIKKELTALEASKTQIHIAFSPNALKVVNDTIARKKEELRVLETSTGRSAGLTGLSDKPTGLDKTKKEKVEVIPGIDFQTKEYGNKLKALIKENQEAGMVINAWWKDNDLKRLDELTKDYKVKKALADKEGIDILNITKKYEDAKNAIMFDSANKKVDFREKARAKIMVVGPDLREFTDAQKIQNAIDKIESSDYGSRLETLGQALYSAQSDFANNLAVGFGEIAGSVLSGGMTIQDSFAALGSLVLNATGDYLVKAGSAAIAAGLVKALFKNALNPAGSATELILGGISAVAAGTAMKQFGSAVSSSMNSKAMPSVAAGGMPSTSVASKASGSSYQYGGSSYATQSIRLMVDLTGSITATQTGYSINKSLETTLRVTGR